MAKEVVGGLTWDVKHLTRSEENLVRFGNSNVKSTQLGYKGQIKVDGE